MNINEFIQLWNNYWTADRVLFAAYMFCAAVQAMGKPTKECSKFYSWFYRFTHILAGNINVAKKESDRISDIRENGVKKDGENNLRPYDEMASVYNLRERREPSLHEKSEVQKVRYQ